MKYSYFVTFVVNYEYNPAATDSVDFVIVELESQIEQLRDIQRKYSNVLRLSRALTSHFYHVVQTQVRNCLYSPADGSTLAC